MTDATTGRLADDPRPRRHPRAGGVRRRAARLAARGRASGCPTDVAARIDGVLAELRRTGRSLAGPARASAAADAADAAPARGARPRRPCLRRRAAPRSRR